MRVILLTSACSRNAGGLFATMTQLSQSLRNRSVDVCVVGTDDEYFEEDKKEYGNVPIHLYQRHRFKLLKTFGYSRDLYGKIEDLHPDIIHLQGLWMYHSYAALRYKLKHPECKLVIEPHGMLDPWAVKNSAWKKKIVSFLFENKNLSTADCIHALCQQEHKSVRDFGVDRPIAIIPNGINLPMNTIFHRDHDKILLFIGRIHPKKGLKELLEGLKLLKEKGSRFIRTWTVRIAGWSQVGYGEELKRLVKEYDLSDNVEFVGSAYGEEKEKELCCANAFILPSFSEGLPMSVLEAWAYKLPVVITDYCNLSDGFLTNSAIHIEPTVESIAEGLDTLSAMTNEELQGMGYNGFNLVKEKYCWDEVAKQTIQLYEWILNGGEKPDFVYD